MEATNLEKILEKFKNGKTAYYTSDNPDIRGRVEGVRIRYREYENNGYSTFQNGDIIKDDIKIENVTHLVFQNKHGYNYFFDVENGNIGDVKEICTGEDDGEFLGGKKKRKSVKKRKTKKKTKRKTLNKKNKSKRKKV
jgi:hypothetical protein